MPEILETAGIGPRRSTAGRPSRPVAGQREGHPQCWLSCVRSPGCAATTPVDVAAALGPVLDGLAAGEVDLSRVRIVCDWLQYKNNFRDVVDVRALCATPLSGFGRPGRCEQVDGIEVAIDLRRAPAGRPAQRSPPTRCGCPLGHRRPGCHWRTGAPAARAASGTSTACTGGRWTCGSRRPAGLRAGAAGRRERRPQPGRGPRDHLGLFDIWDGLVERRALPDELYVAGARRRQRQPGQGLAGRVPPAGPRARHATTTAGCTT